jgi:hypothetical protein
LIPPFEPGHFGLLRVPKSFVPDKKRLVLGRETVAEEGILRVEAFRVGPGVVGVGWDPSAENERTAVSI